MTREFRQWMWDTFSQARGSPDPDRKVGCLIIDTKEKKVIGRGWNAFPSLLVKQANKAYRKARKDNAFKNFITIHAEMKALQHLSATTVSLSPANASIVLFSSSFPCYDCMKAIKTWGIHHIVCPKPRTKSKWKESYEKAIEFAELSGIKITYYQIRKFDVQSWGEIITGPLPKKPRKYPRIKAEVND